MAHADPPVVLQLLPHTDAVAASAFDTIATSMRFVASPRDVWSELMFYEQIDHRPPWYLRALLPVPLGTDGEKATVGDEAMCRYVGGYLVKRVTNIEHERVYGFAVAEQRLPISGGIQLSGGEYRLRELGDGSTEVTSITRYTSPRRPRWLWRRVEGFVGHLFHRHILRAMRRAAEA